MLYMRHVTYNELPGLEQIRLNKKIVSEISRRSANSFSSLSVQIIVFHSLTFSDQLHDVFSLASIRMPLVLEQHR